MQRETGTREPEAPVERLKPPVRERGVVYDEAWFALRRTELFNWMNRRDRTAEQCLDHAKYTIDKHFEWAMSNRA